jgi:nitroreductase
METWDAITARRNVRRFARRPIESADLDRILEAGRRAPSARNAQPWDFVVVTDRAQLEDLAGVSPGAAHVAGSAATIAIVIEDSDDLNRYARLRFDVGQVTMAMMIAATDLGIGSGHAGVNDAERARSALTLPADRRAAMLIDLGYPADRPLRPIERPDRRPFDEVVHRGHW